LVVISVLVGRSFSFLARSLRLDPAVTTVVSLCLEEGWWYMIVSKHQLGHLQIIIHESNSLICIWNSRHDLFRKKFPKIPHGLPFLRQASSFLKVLCPFFHKAPPFLHTPLDQMTHKSHYDNHETLDDNHETLVLRSFSSKWSWLSCTSQLGDLFSQSMKEKAVD